MKDILFFEKMLTPKIIIFVYWVLLLSSVVGGVGSMFIGYGGPTAGKLFMGLLYAVGGVIVVRIWCELLIVLFKINEALQEMRRKSNSA